MKNINIDRVNNRIAFVLDHQLMHYRISFFNLLAKKGYEVHVYHSGKIIENDTILFKQIIVTKKNILKVFDYRKIPSLDDMDVVVCMQNLRMINLYLYSFNFFRKFRLIHWGIGVSTKNGLQKKKNTVSFFRNIISYLADGLVFYSEYPKAFFSKKNLQKSHVAHNTIFNEAQINCCNDFKNSFLFIGSLSKRKGLENLILSFLSYLKSNSHIDKVINKLFIIGSGEMYDELMEMIKRCDLSDHVFLLGAINNHNDKVEYFRQAACVVSPNQAGLSVLESFSFGVPFVCNSNAISGGEVLNIKDGETGYLYSNENELTAILERFNNEKELSKRLGQNAYNFFNGERSMNQMVDTFIESFKS